MPTRVESDTFATRYPDGENVENLAQPSPLPPFTSFPQSPLLSSSWDISSESSTDSGSVTDLPVEPYSDAMAYSTGLQGYDHPSRGTYHYKSEFSEPIQGDYSRPRVVEFSTDVPVVPSQLYSSPRSEFDYFLHGHQKYEIIFTDDANTKLSDRIRRQCFNCKATETSTWRRSILSPGKLLCNKCGLFERTHSIPRPKKFPRRRTPVVRNTYNPHSSVHGIPPVGIPADHHYHQPVHASSLPLPSQSDYILEPFSQNKSHWMPHSPPDATTSLARVNPCYPTGRQPTVYNADRPMPPTSSQHEWI